MDKPSKNNNVVLIKFGEIWLKGGNRAGFIKILHSNVLATLKNQQFDRLNIERDRLVLYLNAKSNTDEIIDSLGFVFGISWFAPAVIVDNTIDAITNSVKSMAKSKQSVRIDAHRSYKKIKFNSADIVRSFIGDNKNTGVVFDKNAKYTIYINPTLGGTFVYDKKIKGLGGLPVGSTGKAISLISGGIDSPVASFYAMKRGLEVVYLHIHAFQTNEEASKHKLHDIIKILCKYSSNSAKIYYAPSHIFQSSVMRQGNRYELVLLKRFMYKLAEKIAKHENANAIVSGESLGQVASQTLSNLTASEHSIKLFIFRPLIAMDKAEIITISQNIASYETSIKQYKDVCSINSRNPNLNSDGKTVDILYKKANLAKALTMTYHKLYVQQIS